jgi:tol-pal system protein YbgF
MGLVVILASCASQKDVSQVATKMDVLEKQNATSGATITASLSDMQRIQKEMEESLRRMEENLRKIEDNLSINMRNQADVKLDQDTQTARINTVTANLDENAHYLKQLDEKIRKLDEKIRELQLLSMESSLANSQKIETGRKGIADSIAVLAARVEELHKSIPQKGQKNQEKKGAGAPSADESASPAAEKPDGGETVNPEAGAEEKPAGKPASKTAEKKIKIPKTISAEDLFNGAYKNFLKGDYSQAQAEFAEYIKRYPNTDLSDNSQYWMGEALANQGKLKESVEAFNLTAKNYPKSPKAPSALWRAAEILGKLGSKEEVRAILVKIHDNYPASYEAAFAEEKLKAIEGHGE